MLPCPSRRDIFLKSVIGYPPVHKFTDTLPLTDCVSHPGWSADILPVFEGRSKGLHFHLPFRMQLRNSFLLSCLHGVCNNLNITFTDIVHVQSKSVPQISTKKATMCICQLTTVCHQCHRALILVTKPCERQHPSALDVWYMYVSTELLTGVFGYFPAGADDAVL